MRWKSEETLWVAREEIGADFRDVQEPRDEGIGGMAR
jgi:hypothetical protein